MKIRVIDRIVLFLLALVVLVLGVCAALNEFGINVLAIVAPLIPSGIMTLMSGTVMFVVRIAAIVVTILLSFYLFSVSFRRKKKPDPFINMESGTKGSIRMSMDSISGLVLRTAGEIPGVSSLKVATINHEDSVSIDLSFQVEMSRNIPELSAQIQQLVGEVVERNCGVAVRSVCVTVSGFTAPAAPKATALPEARVKKEKKGLFHREKKAEEPVAAPVIVPVEPETPVVEEAPVVTEAPMVEKIAATEETVVVEEAPAAVEAEEIPAAEPVSEEETAPVEEPAAAPAEPEEGDEYVLMENE